MNMPWSGLARDLILTFPLCESLAEAEHAASGTAFDMRHTGSIDQPALVLAISRGISLRSNALDPHHFDPLYAIGWQPGDPGVAATRQNRLQASHFGADSQLHMIALDPADNTDGDNLTVTMRKGMATGHVWLTILRTANAFRIGATDLAVANLPRADGTVTAIADHLLDQLRDIASGTSSHRLHRTLISPETAASVLAVYDSADEGQRKYLLGMPMALLCDVSRRALGSSL